MRTTSPFFLPLPAAVLCLACGNETVDANTANGFTGPAAAQLTVTSQRPLGASAGGASYSVNVSFTDDPSRCATQTVGACTINPCSRPPLASATNDAAPSAGVVTLLGTNASPLSLAPQEDGTYANASVAGSVPWTEGGQSVTWSWGHFPGDTAEAGDELTLGTPPYITLASGSAFAEVTTSISRTDDLTVSFTTDGPVTDLDDVAVDVNVGQDQIYCIFPASAGTGVVPAAALGNLPAGQGSYSVHSKRSASKSVSSTDGTTWSFSFNVDASARTNHGFANAWVTVE